MALGAEPTRVLGLIVGEGMKVVGIGLALGFLVSLLLGRFISSQLYGVKTTDPLTLVIVMLLLTAVSFFACFIPARRASRTDPMVALRHE